MKICFWLSFLFIVYTYLLYPAILWITTLFTKTKRPAKSPQMPYSLSVVIAACNEAGNIEKRLHNIIDQGYPPEQLEILIASDGSKDNTVELVQEFIAQRKKEDPAIYLYFWDEQQGKPYAVNLLVSKAKNDIIIFADSRQSFIPATLQELARCFTEPTIGCVSGELFFRKDEKSDIAAEMGLYWQYEKKIRKLESTTGALIGVTGAIYAIRRNLYQPLPPETILDDVLTPMRILMQGYQVIFCEKAIAFDSLSQNTKEEWYRKLRTLAGNWQLFSCGREIFNLKKPFILWRLLSHKIFRLLVPYALILLLFSGFFCTGQFYLLFVILQLLFYGAALAGYRFAALQQYRIFNLPYFFSMLNIAAGSSLFYILHGNSKKLWKRRQSQITENEVKK